MGGLSGRNRGGASHDGGGVMSRSERLDLAMMAVVKIGGLALVFFGSFIL